MTAPAPAERQQPAATGAVGVFCGSRPHPEFGARAEHLGREIARRGARLVYGGGGSGLMGAVSKGAHDAGGAVTGITPTDLFHNERTDTPRGEQFLTRGMHERKELMYRLSDGFIALPGGLGTAEELMEAATWSQLGIHHSRRQKPLVLLNWTVETRGGSRRFFDALVRHLDHTVDEGFLTVAERGLIYIATSASEALDLLGITGARLDATTHPLTSAPVGEALQRGEEQ